MLTEKPDGHGDTLTHQSGEVRRACSDGVTSCALRDAGGGIEEVEDELRSELITDRICAKSLTYVAVLQ